MLKLFLQHIDALVFSKVHLCTGDRVHGGILLKKMFVLISDEHRINMLNLKLKEKLNFEFFCPSDFKTLTQKSVVISFHTCGLSILISTVIRSTQTANFNSKENAKGGTHTHGSTNTQLKSRALT